MRRCKVVATYFGERQHRESADYPKHRQKAMTADDCLEMNKALLKPEDGVHLIVVNNDCGYAPGRAFLYSIRSDSVTVEHRPNIGGGFGAFNYAFQKYRRDFDWWLFCEDDFRVVPSYGSLIERFESEPNCGFLALIGVDDRTLVHAHGGIGLTKATILERVCDRNGGLLPHPDCDWAPNDLEMRMRIEREGEIAFTNEIAQLGYRLVPFGSNTEHDSAIPWFEEQAA